MRRNLDPRNLLALAPRTLGCILGLLIAGLASPSAAAEAYPPVVPVEPAPANLAVAITATTEEDLLCIGYSSGGELPCDVRVYPCGALYCVFICGTGQEEYRPCNLPIAGATQTSSTSALVFGSGEDLLCVGWGSGGITCIVRVHECGNVVGGYCFWSCPTHEIDHGCKLTP